MRRRFVAGMIGMVAALWLVPSASAGTATIGAAASDSGLFFGGCPSPCAYLQETDAASPSYVVPPVPVGGGPWNVTSWSALGGPSSDGAGALEIWRPTGASGEFRLIAIGPEQPFPPNVLTSHPVNIPVLPGDHLGVQAGDADFRAIYSSPAALDAWLSPHELPAVGETAGGSTSDHNPVSRGANGRVNVQATLTSTPAAAPPPTKKKKCKKKKHKRSAESAKKKKCKKRKK